MSSNLSLLHVVADYGDGDLAFTEVLQRLHYLLPHTTILPTSTPSFSTLATGFIISQLALHNPHQNLFIYSNTAPRKDDPKIRPDNAGETFKYALLDNNVQIAAVDAGFCFSFVKDHIKEFKLINVKNQGSQFRSRDFYPQAVAGLINHQKQYLGKEVSSSNIADIPDNKIMHIDGFGNIKTTIRSSSVKFKSGEKIRITIKNIAHTSVYANANFSVKTGDLAFAPGSSGGEDPFMEIFLRSGNAYLHFGKPRVDLDIKFERFQD